MERLRIILSFLLAPSLLFPVFVFGSVHAVVSNEAPRQGDAVVVKFSDKNLFVQSALFDNQQIAFFPYGGSYRAVFGVPANKPPGAYALRITFDAGEVFEQVIRVKARKFTRITLGIPKELSLTPEGLVDKVQAEKVNLDSIVNVRTAGALFRAPFGLPLRDNRKVSSSFGEIRKTGEMEIRHLGVDLVAPLGTAIGAMNGGVIRKTYTDLINGKSVILDHGEGIFSLYFHLNEVWVKEGEAIERGGIIGTVGKTGYATGPHLHLSLKIGGVSVDPFRFVAAFQ